MERAALCVFSAVCFSDGKGERALHRRSPAHPMAAVGGDCCAPQATAAGVKETEAVSALEK